MRTYDEDNNRTIIKDFDGITLSITKNEDSYVVESYYFTPYFCALKATVGGYRKAKAMANRFLMICTELRMENVTQG